ncbi:MAG: trigger factor [Bacteroidota bacterium]
MLEITITPVPGCAQEIEITATAEELIPHIEKAYERYRPKVEIKGFRKGKAPMNMVKKFYGETIEYESLDTIATELYRKAIEEKNLKPIGDPTMVDMNYKRGESFRFKIKHDVLPEITVHGYKGLKIEKLVHPMTDAELQEEVLRLRRINSTRREAEKVEDEEFVVTADLQDLDEAGTPIIGQKQSDARLYLAQEELVKEIKNLLIGATVGSEHRVKYVTQHDDQRHDHHTHILVKKIEKVELPEFNDEFVQKITKEKIKKTDEFMQKLREDIESYWKERSDNKVMDAIANELVKTHEFDVPESIIKGFQDSFVEDLKNRQPGKKLPADFNEEEFRKHNREYAVWHARWQILRERIIEQEQLTVADSDYEEIAETEAKKIGIEKERLITYYKESKSGIDRILSKKLNELLLSNAKITVRETSDSF